MRSPLLASLSLLASAALAAAPAASRHSFSLADLERMRTVSDPQVSPDGRWIAYTVRTTDAKDDKRYTDVWMTSMDGKETTRLTTRKETRSPCAS